MPSSCYIALRLLNLTNGTFPDAIWNLGYQAAPNGYAHGFFSVLVYDTEKKGWG